MGAEYLEILESRNDGILKSGLNSVLLSDEVGNPIKYKYPCYSLLMAPTTLRYLKITSDLKILFGDTFKKVAEIGCGYGGQALVNDQLLNIESTKLFDIPPVNKLIDRYLNSHLFNGSFKTTTINKKVLKIMTWLLVIMHFQSYQRFYSLNILRRYYPTQRGDI